MKDQTRLKCEIRIKSDREEVCEGVTCREKRAIRYAIEIKTGNCGCEKGVIPISHLKSVGL